MFTNPKNWRVNASTDDKRIAVGESSSKHGAQLRANELAQDMTHNDDSDEALIFRSRAARGAKATYGEVSITVEEE